jgi:hypothetical protein
MVLAVETSTPDERTVNSVDANKDFLIFHRRNERKRIMKQHVPQATTSLECPVSKQNCKVSYEVNVFRGASRGGLEVTGCSESLPSHNAVTCVQGCIHTLEAQQLHEQEIRKHQDDLSNIGPNVIG